MREFRNSVRTGKNCKQRKTDMRNSSKITTNARKNSKRNLETGKCLPSISPISLMRSVGNREDREKTEAEIIAARKEHDTALRREKREVEAKESALRSALDDLARAQSLLDQRETDFSEAQDLLKSLEDNNRKLDESIATDRFSLQLEVDRLKRDVERLESEVTRARMELGNREAKTRNVRTSLTSCTLRTGILQPNYPRKHRRA